MRTLVLSYFLIIQFISSILLGLEVSGQCHGDQQYLLLQLKKSLIFHTTASKLDFVDWNPSTDCSTWDGVTCHEGCVAGLDLSNRNIVGGIDNSSLFNLQHLKSLDLSLNDFGTPIPSGFGMLADLRYLNLSNAGFVGQIPIDLSGLTGLVNLDLSTNFALKLNLLKLEKPNLFMLIQNFSKLEELHLDGVDMSASGSKWCQALSSSLPNLRVLSLSRCSLSGPIDDSLGKLQSLSTIRLDDNNLSTLVPGFLTNFTNLNFLHLSVCELHGVFPQEIFQVPTLQVIELSYNSLLQGSLPEFSRNNSLRRLVISYTSFSGILPTSINNLKKLSFLELTENQFNGTLPNFMLPELVYLDLSLNNFTGPIPPFRMARNLMEIVLSHNGLTGAITLAHWEGLMKLVAVDLWNNSFSGSIPSSLFALPSLEEIQLSHNGFDGQLPEFTNPSSSLLAVLELSSNNLEGPIPVSIFELRKLIVLSLSFNKLNSTIQSDMIQGLTTLLTLDLSYNNLSFNAWGASFPKNIITLKLASCKLTKFPHLKNLSNVNELDLSDNQIHGLVPNWIWEVGNESLFYLNLSVNYLVGIQEPYIIPSSLNTIDLHFNQIRGKIPIPPPFASYIDFSSNNFNSSIPADIGDNLLPTIFLSLADNGLTGIIPKSMCSARSIYVLDLSDNSLSGRIPSCLFELTQFLLVLNLRGNNFSGPIPSHFSVYCGLKTLDLSGNLMEGKIPNSLARCSELETLDLGNNYLVGEFPCFLKTISTLRVLVLRSNRFHGGIGCSNTNDTWETLQIIDLARNNFSGGLPARSLAKWNGMKMNDKYSGMSKLDPLQVKIFQLSPVYYRDSVAVTSKGLELRLVKILIVYTSIDFSSNNFQGPIPEEIGALTLLYVLNFSNNAFSGPIPSALSKLRQLESLDLSRNKLSGAIPTSLANLNFLSYLNLSFNELVGRVPSGSQFQTFSGDSFVGNEGLCGFPLVNSKDEGVLDAPKHDSSESGSEIDWNLLSVELGFVVGFGIVVGLILFCKRWRKTYFETVENVAFKFFRLAITRKWFQWILSR